MRKRLASSLLLALILTVLLALPVLAQGEQPGKLILGGSYTLGRGETLYGGVAIAGGDVVFEEGSRVAGDVLLAGGQLEVAGRIDGDVAVFGGRLHLRDSAYVDGDVISFGGTIQRDSGAVVTGRVNEGNEFSLPGFRGVFPAVPVMPFAPEVPATSLRASPGEWLLAQFGRMLRSLGLTLAMTALALVGAVIWPKGIERIGRTVQEQTFLAFAVGLLTWVLAIGLAVVMVLTICLIPLAVVLSLIIVIAIILSWIATGWVIGRLLLGGLKVRNTTLVVEAVLGTLLLFLTYFLVSIIPCLDFIFGTLVVCLGTGAIVLTRFGTQPYTPGIKRGQPMPPPAPLPTALPSPAGPPAVRTSQELGLPANADEIANQASDRSE